VNSREAILTTLRRNAPPVLPLPEAPPGVAYADPEKQFAEVFTSVGGKFLRVASLTEVNSERETRVVRPGAQNRIVDPRRRQIHL
jgi:hypothetical protein